MKASVNVERLRIPVTWCFAILLVILILFSTSKWEGISVFSEILFLFGCFFVAIASLGRLWCSLYIAGYKTETLVTAGPYSMCRNPLYLFSCIGGIGVGLATETLLIPFIVLLAFTLYYPYVIKSEQVGLQEIHGLRFETYYHSTPAFFPKFSLLNEPEQYTVNPKIFKKHILDALWFVWLVGILEFIEGVHELEIIPVLFKIY